VRKNYSSTGRICRVTFELPAAVPATEVSICGDFNHWDPAAHPLERRKDGRFSRTVSLTAGRRYRFRYLIDGTRWENDWAADDYAQNEFGTDDSVVEV
jgi:1,4-alpha-glucan branching enzyme